MQSKLLHIIIVLCASIPNVIMCWGESCYEESKNIPLEINQTVVITHQPTTTAYISTTIASPEEENTKKAKKKHHHHKKKKKHKKHHHHRHHRHGSEDEDLTISSIVDNTIETVFVSTQKSLVPTGLMHPSPKITHSPYLITETKTRLYIKSSATPSHTNTDGPSHTTTTIVHQSPELPLSPSVSSSINSHNTSSVATIKVKTSYTPSLSSNALPFKAPTPVSDFPFVVITSFTTTRSNLVASSSSLSDSCSQTLSHPTHYAIPPPEPQENRPGYNPRRGEGGDPNEFRNQPVDLNSTNRDIGLGVGIGIAGFATIILLGLLVQRYKRKRNNQNDHGVYFSEKESHKSILSSMRPNSFIKVVQSAVSRFPSKSSSIDDNLIAYPPELYSPVKATYHESFH